MKDGYRKIERKNELTGKWVEISFSELSNGDKFKVTDLEEDGSITEGNFEKGNKIYLASSDPSKNDKGVYGIECDTVVK